jgi:site-specific DNA-methyltransferase (adenine-specific)/adenine-specific DNA-methyltransferase
VTTSETPTPLSDLVQAAFLGDDTPAAQAAIGELVERVDELPPRLRQALEQTGALAQGEARLSYASKWPTAKVLDIAPVPLQPVTAFGDVDGAEWHNRLVFGDNLGVLAALVRMKQRGELKNADGTDGVRVCYIDPPFATQREFDTKGQVAYKDKVDGADFVEFLRKRLILIRELLADDGTLYVHLDTKKVHYVKVVLDEIFGESCFQSEVVWKRTSSKNTKTMRRYGRIHETLLVYTRSPATWIWNPQFTVHDPEMVRKRYRHDDNDGRGPYRLGDLGAPGSGGYVYDYKGYRPGPKGWRCPESTMRQYDVDGLLRFPKSKTGRIEIKKYLNQSNGVQLQDIWTDVPWVAYPVYPTEKPQPLLERVIKASSNEGDLVLDCFTGSGSTLRAAERLGRRWIGVDAGKLAIHTATRELVKLGDDPDVELQPFAVSHAGLYDPDRLEQLDHDSWTSFVLDLYNAQHKTDTRHGITFHGRLGSGTTPTLVHVLDPAGDRILGAGVGGRRIIDQTWLEHFARTVKAGARTSLAVICPTDAAPSLRDSDYEIAWHDSSKPRTTRIRVLKVPPAITNEFLAISQAGKEDEVNALIESHGFDIAQPPIVDIAAKVVGGKPVIDITRFESNAIVRDRKGHASKAPTDPREDLAMVLVDHHYDQDRFDFEDHHFGDALAKAKFRITLSTDALTSDTGLILIDRFGNEARLVVKASEFKS